MPSLTPFLTGFCALFLAGVTRLPAQAIDPASGDAPPFPGTPVTGYKLAWSDEFNGTALDTTKWNYRTDTRYWSLQRPENVRVADGALHLDLKKETFGATSYTGGGAISKELFRYGYYEARMKVPPGGGWHTSFWMMKYNRPATDTVAIELDVIENDSVTPLKYAVNTHRHLPTPHLTYGTKTVNTAALDENFHVFGCEFTPTAIRYFFEGNLVKTVNATQFPHNDLNIWLTSIAAPLGGTTSVDDTQLPASALFDYVRFFVPGATASVNITAPGSAGVTLASTDHSLHVAATAGSSDPALTPTIQWSKFSGPGDVTFANPAALTTSVRVSEPGTYLLQCTATVDGNPTSARVPVAVDAALPAIFRQSFDGYNHTATFIRGDSPAWNSGARDQMIVGRWNNESLRLLLSYEITGLPADATIEDATLELRTDSGGGTGTVGDLELRALAQTPVEGTGTGTSASDGAGSGCTWVSRTGGTAGDELWTAPGADFESDVLSSAPGFDATLKEHPVVFPGSSAFTALAENARATASPLNLMVRSPATETGSVNAISRIASDDNSNIELRPQLTVFYRGNYAPAPAVGTAPAAIAGAPAFLTGSAGHATASQWTQLSGPAAAVFADASVPAASVTFPMAGEYTLQLTASNALAEASATLAVTVAPAPTALEQWQALHFGSLPRAEDIARLADPDQDSLPNLLEFAIGSIPTEASGSPVLLTAEGAFLELTYPRSHAAVADGVRFAVEWSDTLGSGWSTENVTEAVVPEFDNGLSELWKATVPAGNGGSRFLRLRVTTANP